MPGDLPGAGAPIVGGVALPAGRVVSSAGPLLWLTDDVVTDVGARWGELRRAFAATGLWPVLLDWHPTELIRAIEASGEVGGHLVGLGEGDRIALDRVDEYDADAVLRRGWRMPSDFPPEVEMFRELRAPSATAFPGLADTTGWPEREGWPDDVAVDELTGDSDLYLGLVPVDRPADVVATMNWTHPVATGAFVDMTAFTAVLRSWEDRFGAVPVRFGYETLLLAVQRPPETLDRALAVTAEHEAFCSDNLWQNPLADRFATYAPLIVGMPRWHFWWD